MLVSVMAVACGGAEPPPATPSSPSAATSMPAAATDALAPPLPTASASATPPATGRPLDLTNNCGKDVKLYFGEQPGIGKGTFVTVPGGASVPVPRHPDGTVTVWVVDESQMGLASVSVTKHMRHVRIDATCRKIEADSNR